MPFISVRNKTINEADLKILGVSSSPTRTFWVFEAWVLLFLLCGSAEGWWAFYGLWEHASGRSGRQDHSPQELFWLRCGRETNSQQKKGRCKRSQLAVVSL